MSSDQPSWTKEIGKGFVYNEQSEREGPSRRMEKFEPNHGSKTSNQGAESSIKVKMSSDQPSWTKEIGKGFVCNKQSEREGSSRRMEKLEPNHSPKNSNQGAEPSLKEKISSDHC